MNGQLMELWGRTMLTVFPGPNQADSMTGWLQRIFQDAVRMNSSFFQIWGLPTPFSGPSQIQCNWEKAWEPLLRMQQFSMQWIGMVPQSEYAAQSRKISSLEEKVAQQARTIERMQDLINKSGEAGNNALIHQFQGLIDEQSRQFQQLTTSVGEFIKSGANKRGVE